MVRRACCCSHNLTPSLSFQQLVCSAAAGIDLQLIELSEQQSKSIRNNDSFKSLNACCLQTEPRICQIVPLSLDIDFILLSLRAHNCHKRSAIFQKDISRFETIFLEISLLLRGSFIAAAL